MTSNNKNKNYSADKIRFYISLTISFLLLAVMWILYFFSYTLGTNFDALGLRPRTINGLLGIIFMPFVHLNFQHLFSNSFPFLILSTILLYFYRPKSYLIALLIWLFTGIFTWIIGREGLHIGASGVIYGYAAFIFFAGLLSRKKDMMAIAMIVIFFYGSMIWGIFPQLDEKISWEGHLSGFAAGTLWAVVFTKSKKITFKTADKI